MKTVGNDLMKAGSMGRTGGCDPAGNRRIGEMSGGEDMDLLQIVRQLKDYACDYILIESALFFGNSAAEFSLDGETMVDLKKCIEKLRHIDKTARIFIG